MSANGFFNTKRKELLLLLVTVIVVGSFALIAFRFFKEHQIEDGRNVNADFIKAFPVLQSDPEFGWRNKPGAKMFPQKVPIEKKIPYLIMNDGTQYLGDTTGLPEVKKELWVVGDSSAFGLGAAARQTFAARLFRTLQTDGILVRNFAVIGYNSTQALKLIEKKLTTEKIKPWAIILWVGFNDVMPFFHSYFWRNPAPQFLWDYRFHRNIIAISNLTRSMGIHVFEVTIPCFNPLSYLDELNDWILAPKPNLTNLTIIDVRTEFASIGAKSLYAKFDEATPFFFHPSEVGHARIEEMLLPEIRKLLAVGTLPPTENR